MIITAGGDGSTKIFELKTLRLLKKLTFRASTKESTNYPMRGLKYDSYYGCLYTIQAPRRGSCYLTKWNAKNFEPVNSIIVSDTICTSMDYSPYYNMIGIADCGGKLIQVDVSGDMKVVSTAVISENTVKTVTFKNGNLITGAADNALKLNHVKSSIMGSFSFGFILKFIVIFLIAYHIFLKYKAKVA